MLFLLKRTWQTAVPAMLVLSALGVAGRLVCTHRPEFNFSVSHAGIGVLVVVGVIASDVLLHLLFCGVFGPAYRRRHAELVAIFRGQTNAAILAGALMAGVGEELVFRGLGSDPTYLIGAAVAFGALHHVRRRLWPFSIWAAYQGALFAVALLWTESLSVPMTAHFLHDLIGFLLFSRLNGAAAAAGESRFASDPGGG
jgi:membrane protease YdiL (CAAX protease family)